MTLDDFLNKYTRCPFCESYLLQGNLCYGCKYKTPYPKENEFDLFRPTDEWIRRINREVDE